MTEVAGPRWEFALERLADGGAIAFDQVGIRLLGADHMLVRPAWTSTRRPTLAEADHAFDRASALLETLAGDERFARIVSGRVPEYELLEDYRTGAVVRADRRGGQTQLR